MSTDTSSAIQKSWLWQPSLIVFISNVCIMVIELVAGRMIAPHVGSSLYTWTSVIGVVLAGITVGNYLGGWLADKWASFKFLGIVYLLAALGSVSILAMDRLDPITPLHLPIIAEIIALTAALFFVPSMILGMISPIVAKLAVRDLAKTGSTVGKIYAAGAAGSIVGTFFTGFVLISWFGMYTIVWGVAGILTLFGLLFLLVGRWQSILLAAIIIGGTGWLALNQGWNIGPCKYESNYYCIKIYDTEDNGKPVRQLVLDHLVHSFVQLDDPTRLVYGYEKEYAELAQYWKTTRNHLSIAMIGGGGYTFARYIDVTYPGSDMHVIEIDPEVTRTAYRDLNLNPQANVVTFNEDARMFFKREPDRKYDLILGDAFNHYSVPYHLTTKEFNDRVKMWLTDDGLYIVNIIDGAYGEFMRSYYTTLTKSFKYVYLAEGNPDWKNASRSFFVLVGTDKPLNLDEIAKYDGGDGDALFHRTIASPERIQKMLSEIKVVTFTDDYVPADQMLASVHSGDIPTR